MSKKISIDSFPILTSNIKASKKSIEEIAMRYKYGDYDVQSFLFDGGYLEHLSYEDILSKVLSVKDAIFMETLEHSNTYSLVPCFDLIRDLQRENNLFMSIKNGEIHEFELQLDEEISIIPNEISNLTSLSSLVLYITDNLSNNLFGDEFILKSVTNLVINCYSYANIPDLFYYFPNLKYLRIRGFQCLPDVAFENSFSKITKLESLTLTNVNLEALPNSIKHLKRLRLIHFFNLPLKQLPVALIGELESLNVLNLNGNQELNLSVTDVKFLEKQVKVFWYNKST